MKNLVMSKILKRLVYFFFFKLVFQKKYFLNSNNLYYKHFGFGDFVVFCLYVRNYLNNNKKILCYSKSQYDVARFFFNKDKIVKTKFLLPRFLSEAHIGSNILKTKSFFRPIIIPKKDHFNNELALKPNLKISRFINDRLKKNVYSKKILKFIKKKYIVMHIKHFNNNKNSLHASIRQTTDLTKVFEILKFLDDKIKIILFLNKKDNFYKIIKKNKKFKFKNIFYITDFIQENYFATQVLLNQNSIGYIGSHSGANILNFFNNKKSIIFDTFYLEDHTKYNSNLKFLYKKIKVNNSINILNDKIFENIKKNNKKYDLIETKIEELTLTVKKHFNFN